MCCIYFHWIWRWGCTFILARRFGCLAGFGLIVLTQTKWQRSRLKVKANPGVIKDSKITTVLSYLSKTCGLKSCILNGNSAVSHSTTTWLHRHVAKLVLSVFKQMTRWLWPVNRTTRPVFGDFFSGSVRHPGICLAYCRFSFCLHTAYIHFGRISTCCSYSRWSQIQPIWLVINAHIHVINHEIIWQLLLVGCSYTSL